MSSSSLLDIPKSDILLQIYADADGRNDDNLPGQPFLSQTAQSPPWDPGSPVSQSAGDESSFDPSSSFGQAQQRGPARHTEFPHRARRFPQQAAGGEGDQAIPLPARAVAIGQISRPTQGLHARQSQAVGNAPRLAQSNVMQRSGRAGTLRGPQPTSQKAASSTASMANQLKVSCVSSSENM